MLTIRRDGKDRPNTVPWPPILLLGTLVVTGFMEWAARSPADWHTGWVRALGVMLALGGIAAAVTGIVTFNRIGTPTDPTARAAKLASQGIYAWTRNPMYLGMVLLVTGLGLALPSFWMLGAAPLLLVALQKLAIEREEAFLDRRFGADYRAYKARVRRWI